MTLKTNREFSDPAAEVVWAAICALPDGAQHQISAQLTERLSVIEQDRPGHDFRRARAVAALREAARILDHSPTVSEYRDLRARHAEFGWPPDGTIRRLLTAGASWNGALGEARLDAVSDPEPSRAAQGPELLDEEIRAALHECAGELGQPLIELSYSSYLLWARQPEVRARPGRRPLSAFPFHRRGGWLEVKQRILAGEPLSPRDVEAAGGDEAPNAETDRRVVRSDGSGYAYTDDQLFAAADEILERLPAGAAWPRLPAGAAWPTTGDWMRERAAILKREAEQGLPARAFPSRVIPWQRFGHWPKFREAYERARERHE